MSAEIEQLVRRGYEVFNVTKAPEMDGWHPDGEYINSRDDPDPGVHRGHDAVAAQFTRWVDSYPDLTVEPLEIRVNGDRIFVWVRFAGHGAGSGAPLDMELAHIWTIEDDKIRRIEEFSDRDEGLAAAGLQQQDS
jgi:ketosteroid isomerase-like protein